MGFNNWYEVITELFGLTGLEEVMATPSSILARKIPRTEEPSRLWSMGSQRVRHDKHTHFSSVQLLRYV